MDSLTQITLGAAVGEAILGKKVGNRAMFWGAVGGTIPDLDVLANPIMSEVDALAFHRGISHSFFFAVIAALIMGWIIDRFYRHKYYRQIAFGGWAAFVGGLIVLLNIILKKPPIHLLSYIISAAFFVYLIFRLWKKYLKSERELPNASVRDWQWLFFGSIVTHPILDAFTTYGTQLFQPFSDYRVAWNTISVADPIYTVPFLLCVVICSFLSRNSPNRRWINYLGLSISSAYLLFTVFNKSQIDTAFRKALEDQGYTYERLMTTPTILNNILWQGIAQKGERYYLGSYSLFDTQDITFTEVIQNEPLLNNPEDRTIKILKWFTNGYYNVMRRNDGNLQVNDLRYGSFSSDYHSENSYIFRFPLRQNDDGSYDVIGGDGGPPPGSEKDMMSTLLDRIRGN